MKKIRLNSKSKTTHDKTDKKNIVSKWKKQKKKMHRELKRKEDKEIQEKKWKWIKNIYI